jgi:hypothetical protein
MHAFSPDHSEEARGYTFWELVFAQYALVGCGLSYF